MSILDWIAYSVFTLVLIYLINIFISNGLTSVLKKITSFLLLLPGSNSIVKIFTKKEIDSFIKEAFGENVSNGEKRQIIIPENGDDEDTLKGQLIELKKGNKDLSQRGRLFAYVYTSEGSHFQLQKEAFLKFTSITTKGSDDNMTHNHLVGAYLDAFMHDNALNPLIFPALRKFENEVASMTSWMLNGDAEVVGSVTSGGTESCLMAVKTHRDRGRHLRPNITTPNIVAPSTIHPAFAKAAHYFGLELKLVPVSSRTFTCNLQDYKDAIDKDTVLLLASAPSYPQAILDPIKEISEIAESYNLPLHVDACFGGFMLPWIEKLKGHKIPPWDFRLRGVTSISADLHKYGYATKGASVICYRNSEIRKFQFFAHVGWPGGLFVSPTMAGTRPGGHLAAAWVALRAMGQSGYLQMAQKLMDVTKRMKDEVGKISGLKVLGTPLMTAFSFTTEATNIFSLADLMEEKGMCVNISQNFLLCQSLCLF